MKMKMRFLALAIICALAANGQSGIRTNFSSGWEFRRDPQTAWEKVTLPHTARIEPLIVNDQFQGKCTYRKTFDAKDSAGKKTFVYFEGVMQEAEVWCNGRKIMDHKGGYLPFTADLSDCIKAKGNLLEVNVRNTDNPEIPPGKPLKDLDFNYYGGIYRNVYLVSSSKLYITNAVAANRKAGGGIFVSFDSISNNRASAKILVDIRNDFASSKSGQLKIAFTDASGTKTEFTSTFTIGANSDRQVLQQISIRMPKLWSVADPNLYTISVGIISDGKLVSSYSEKTGIRKSEIRADGYYLNDKKIFIAGTNRHQEYPYVGYAISDEAQYRDAVKIKQAGFDFVRLSHYPQAEAFINACDELGILVMESIPGWQFFGDAAFQEHSLQDARDMIRRDRNHASVIFWEASLNESGMNDDFMKRAAGVVREELPYGNNISAGWIDNPSYDLYIPARQHTKAPDYWTKYDKGSRKILIAEYGDWEYYAQNAGFSQKEYANLREEERTSRQSRGFGERRMLQQAFNFQQASNSNRHGKNTIGEANWLMFDYNRGYANDIENSGISDIFRIPKFAFDYYRSQRDADEHGKIKSGPMVKIASFWNDKSPSDVTVYSNCDEVALYLNEKLIIRQKPLRNPDSDSLTHPPFKFSLERFTPGTLRAEGFINGKPAASDLVRTPETPKRIILEYDLSSVPVNASRPDIVFVYAKIIDANGTLIPDASDPVAFEIEGRNAMLIGANPISAEAGIATILLKTTDLKKPVIITAKSGNLQPAKLMIK